jgi:endonuclease/exonuclease/phosphatase family metal-dependent hydrolase
VPGRAVAILATVPYVGDIVVVSFYGDAHDQRHTQTMLEHLGDRLSRVGKPFLILGDFNAAPSSVAEWASQLGLPARVVATAQPTCVMTSSDRVIDYCLVHRCLSVLPHAVDTNLEGVAYPHLGVLLSITLPAVDEVVDVLKRPEKFAAADRV